MATRPAMAASSSPWPTARSRSRGLGDVCRRRGHAGPGHEDRGNGAGLCAADHARPARHAEWPQDLPWRLHLRPGRQRVRVLVGSVMYAGDAATQGLDMKIEEMAPGYARLTMRVRPDMLNGHKTCHGGFIFALADSAFAFSCNSRNVSTVASGCTIDYLAPGFEGD